MKYALYSNLSLSVGLYDDQQCIKMSQVDPPLELFLSASLRGVARLFSGHLKSIGKPFLHALLHTQHPLLLGVSIQIEGCRVFTTSLPAVLMEREVEERKRGRPAVAVHLLQVSLCSCDGAWMLTLCSASHSRR